jgi:hypothetical protein
MDLKAARAYAKATAALPDALRTRLQHFHAVELMGRISGHKLRWLKRIGG